MSYELGLAIKEKFVKTYNKSNLEKLQNTCEHKNIQYMYSHDDWYDGDSDDHYVCTDCSKTITIYIGR